MLNSLLFENYMDIQQRENEVTSSPTSEEHGLKPLPPLEPERETDVHCWSVDDVVAWLRTHVPLESDRIQECARAFQNEGIDGFRLLTLQRNNGACSGISDAEWILLYSARENLLANERRSDVPSESHPSSPFSSPRSTKENFLDGTSPKSCEHARLRTSKSLTLRSSQRKPGLVKSSLRFLSFSSRYWWSSPSTKKDEQKTSTATEVSSLHEEILSAEEREAALKAKVDHLDEILRKAQLASYLYTRMRWTPLPGELPVDDVDVDDWLQRFLVLEGSALFFYPRAADLRPQGAILFSEIVDIGAISGKIQQDGESISWFGFHITTREGLRLECATPIQMQADLWMSLIQTARTGRSSSKASNGDCVEAHTSEAANGVDLDLSD